MDTLIMVIRDLYAQYYGISFQGRSSCSVLLFHSMTRTWLLQLVNYCLQLVKIFNERSLNGMDTEAIKREMIWWASYLDKYFSSGYVKLASIRQLLAHTIPSQLLCQSGKLSIFKYLLLINIYI
jgi:hypothetical protein